MQSVSRRIHVYTRSFAKLCHGQTDSTKTRRAKGMGCRLFYVSLLLLQIFTYKVSSHIALMLNFQALGPPPRTLTALDPLAVVDVYIILVPRCLLCACPLFYRYLYDTGKWSDAKKTK